jgi:hypothetical protein
MSLKVALTIGGALAETVALLLVVWEIAYTRRQAAALLSRPSDAAPPIPSAAPMDPLNPHEREMARAQAQHAAIVSDLTPPSRDDLIVVAEAEADLRAKLADDLLSGRGRRALTAALLALGIGCSAAANLV